MAFIVEGIDSRQIVKNKRKVVKSSKIACTECSRNLGELIETEPKLANDTEIKNIFVCPCGGESFTAKSKYNTYFLAAEGLITASISTIDIHKYKSFLENYNGD